jgi:hypothetical protein
MVCLFAYGSMGWKRKKLVWREYISIDVSL